MSGDHHDHIHAGHDHTHDAVHAHEPRPEYLRLERAVREPTGVASLCWGVRGLAAHARDVTGLGEALVDAAPRAKRAGGVYKLALVALAGAAIAAQTKERSR
jgi:hypothetical protein